MTAVSSAPTQRQQSATRPPILVIEPVRHGHEHQAFNGSTLLSCQAGFPGHPIIFAAERHHLAAIREMLPPDARVSFEPITIAARHATATRRMKDDWRIVNGLFSKAGAVNAHAVLMTSVTKTVLWGLKCLRGRRSLPPTLAVFHGGLMSELRMPHYNLFARMLSLRNAMLGSAGEIRFAVLEDVILETLRQKAPELAGRFMVFPHPLPPDLLEAPELSPRDMKPPWKVGLLGLCTPQKGTLRFLRLAKRSMEAGLPVQFEIIGRIHADIAREVEPYLRYLHRVPCPDRIPRAQFIEAVRALDFAAFLFEGRHYMESASGVLLDCIALGIPLLHDLPAPLMHSLGVRGDEIGIQCATGDDLTALAEGLHALDAQDPLRMRETMLRLRASRAPERLGPDMARHVGA